LDERIKILREELSRAEKGGEGNAALMTLEQDMRTATGERLSVLVQTLRVCLHSLALQRVFVSRKILQ
jgi:hypothetical protein